VWYVSVDAKPDVCVMSESEYLLLLLAQEDIHPLFNSVLRDAVAWY
jgi:hypothetical protein